MTTQPRTVASAFGLALILAVMFGAVPGGATSLPVRTVRPFDQGDGTSRDPALSLTGRILAFESNASDLVAGDVNGRITDVFTLDRTTRQPKLVSVSPGGGNGPSVDPVLSADGRIVVFSSSASNLVANDRNGVADIFMRVDDRPIERVSVSTSGAEGNLPSTQPDVSADGRYVVFTSTSSTLVEGDTNRNSDVFIRDVVSRTTRRISIARGGGNANRRSTTPAISGDGDVVSFESQATNLVRRDTNRVADVFVRDLSTRRTERVSVSTSGRQQDKSVPRPFHPTSDVNENGRYVAFDSDSGRLVSGDRNRRTDVFVRDRVRDRTTLVSENNEGFQGNNDSFAPVMTPNGRFVAFQSLATNLSPGGGTHENLFIRDLRLQATSIVNVSATGGARGDEPGRPILQRVAMTNEAQTVAFSSTATNLVPDDTNGAQDVFLRFMAPPHAEITSAPPRYSAASSVTVGLAADDPRADRFLCRVGSTPAVDCESGTNRIPRQRAGRRTLLVRAGGRGMLYETNPVRVRFTVDGRAPTVRITSFGRDPLRRVSGRVTDRGSGVAKVEVAVAYVYRPRRCRNFDGQRFVNGECTARVWLTPRGTRTWSLRLPAGARGFTAVFVRATDRAGNRSRVRTFARVIRG
jgi:Tol biopolymer transport system component